MQSSQTQRHGGEIAHLTRPFSDGPFRDAPKPSPKPPGRPQLSGGGQSSAAASRVRRLEVRRFGRNERSPSNRGCVLTFQRLRRIRDARETKAARGLPASPQRGRIPKTHSPRFSKEQAVRESDRCRRRARAHTRYLCDAMRLDSHEAPSCRCVARLTRPPGPRLSSFRLRPPWCSRT